MLSYQQLMYMAGDVRAARDAARRAAAAACRAARWATSSRRRHPARAAAAAAAAYRAARSGVPVASRVARELSDTARFSYPKEHRIAMLKARGAPPPQTGEYEPGLDVLEKDLESDEAIWALYKDWCEAYDKERDHDQMARRFDFFKRAAHGVYSNNQVYMYEPEEQRRLGPFADGLYDDNTMAIWG
ncbi:hypothetical protein U9M48_002144 [Paspalum notatum var. saurae]|uniref:Cathepsin propeptide inhibitor domain-containing protein n=1 Tax=Paspalum notatum var. saurae TaxID=547442 RepID=A0AAQ3SFR5_PASNO